MKDLRTTTDHYPLIRRIGVTALALVSLLGAAELPPFRPAPASAWPSNQSFDKAAYAAVRYESDADLQPVFGKVDLPRYGVLPVLLIIENRGKESLLLDRMQVEFNAPGGIRLEPTPVRELPFLIGPKRPGQPSNLPIPLPKKKNPLGGADLDARAWGARTILPGESAHGFFYFQTQYRRGAKLYVNGIREAGTNKELFYVDVPLDAPSDAAAPKPDSAH